MSRMFPFIHRTWNPVTGCLHNCSYCFALKLAKGRLKRLPRYKDGFNPTLNHKELQRFFRPGEFVFVSDMGDLFGEWIPNEWIYKVFNVIEKFSETDFLLLTKNPRKFLKFMVCIPLNCVCAATIETNRSTRRISKAPPPRERFEALRDLAFPRKAVSIEPIMDFDMNIMLQWIKDINPEFVAIGYDNHKNHLIEPSLSKTNRLISEVKSICTVYRKSLRRGRVNQCGSC